MDVTPLIRKDQQVIQSYANGTFKVSGVAYTTPILVIPDKTEQWELGDIRDVTALQPQHFSELTKNANQIDVVLLGCGKVMCFMPPKLKADLKTAGLSVDIMDTGAACRTYNILMAEGRRVACALLPA